MFDKCQRKIFDDKLLASRAEEQKEKKGDSFSFPRGGAVNFHSLSILSPFCARVQYIYVYGARKTNLFLPLYSTTRAPPATYQETRVFVRRVNRNTRECSE